MKKRILFMLTILTFMVVGISNVSGATLLTQNDFDNAKSNVGIKTDKGITCIGSVGQRMYLLDVNQEYTLTGTISLDGGIVISGTNDLVLDNAVINSIIVIGATSKVNLTGTGILKDMLSIVNGDITVDGNIVFDGLFSISTEHSSVKSKAIIKNATFNQQFEALDAIVTIDNATFNDTLYLKHSDVTINNALVKYEGLASSETIMDVEDSNLTINGGTYKCEKEGDGFYLIVNDDSDITINDGLFYGNAMLIENDSSDGTVKINGGIFDSNNVSLYVGRGKTILTGGIFKYSGTSNEDGAIVTDKDFNGFLAEGYMYSPSISYITDQDLKILTLKEVKVIHEPYELVDDAAKTFTKNSDEALSFEINADYSLFENGGKVYIDDTEIFDFTSSSGSTIITLNKSLLNTLSEKEHTLKVLFKNGGIATTTFNISKMAEQNDSSIVSEENVAGEGLMNPKTSDSMPKYIITLGVSIIVLISIVYNKRIKIDN